MIRELLHEARSVVLQPRGLVGISVVGSAAIAAHVLTPTTLTAIPARFLQSLHGPGFALVALAVFLIVGQRSSVYARYLITLGATLGIGLISEAAQITGPRDAQISDLLIDGSGAVGRKLITK